MKTHTTNYRNTFIQIAEDCPAMKGELPPMKGSEKTAANIQFEMIYNNPYKFTSDDVLFQVYANKKTIQEAEYRRVREEFFSKGKACFRASPLAKRYGWGIHSDKDGKIALYGCETDEYKKLSNDRNLKVIKAMRSDKKQINSNTI